MSTINYLGSLTIIIVVLRINFYYFRFTSRWNKAIVRKDEEEHVK